MGLRYIFVLCLLGFGLNARAGGPKVAGSEDPTQDQALLKTQETLRSSAGRQEIIHESKAAQEVDQRVKELAGSSASEQEIYDLAADVLGNMKDKSPEQMMQILEQAQKDPAAFAKSWTPAQKKKLEELSQRLPAAQQKRP